MTAKKKSPATKKKPAKAPTKKAKVAATAKRAAQKLPKVKMVTATPPIPPDFEASLDEDTVASLRSATGPRDYVLRTRDGAFLHDVSDLVIANQLARALGVRVKVFKRTKDGEVLMSYSGPGKWD